MKKLLSFAISLNLTGCTALRSLRPTANETESTRYYYGDVKFYSPDGKIFYGQTFSLVQRTIDSANGKIVEIVLQPSREPNQEPKEFITTLTRRPGTNVFDAADDGNTFSGTLSFSGEEWQWNGWRYDIKMRDGGRLTGEGSLDAVGIHTRKTVSNAQGKTTVRLIEDLSEIDERAYHRHRREILRQ